MIIKITEKQIRQHRAMRSHTMPDDTRLSDLAHQVDATAQALSHRLHLQAKQLAKSLMYWVRRAPLGEREDLLQELTIKLLQDNPQSMALAFTALKRDTIDYMRHYYSQERSNLSISQPLGDEADLTIGDIIPDTIDSISIADLKMDTIRLLSQMDEATKRAAKLQLSGVRLTRAERACLQTFERDHLGGNYLSFVYA